MAPSKHSSTPQAAFVTLRRITRHTLFCGVIGGLLPCANALALQTHHTATATQTSSKPLTKAGLEKALRTGATKSPEIVAIIKKRGVDFPLDHDTELELRGAGADANVIEAVGQNYRSTAPNTQIANNGSPQAVPPPAAPPVLTAPTPVAPPPPPAPTFRDITIPAGTVLPIQMTQTLDSATTLAGQTFNGVLSQDIIVGNMVVVQRGAAVLGRVTEAKDAAHFAGSSRLTIELSSVTPNSMTAPMALNASPVTKQGAGRGRSTAGKSAGGAALGAVMGGIFGGGKGAAVGAAAGGGAGAGSSAITKGEQVQFPSESIVQFTLASPLLIRVPLGGPATMPASAPQPLPR